MLIYKIRDFEDLAISLRIPPFKGKIGVQKGGILSPGLSLNKTKWTR